MNILILYTIGIICASCLGGIVNKNGEDAILADTSKKEDNLLDESLFAGLLDGYTFTLDCVTLSKHDHNHDNPSEKALKKEHDQNLKEAKLEADYMTKHRPLESQKVSKKEANLFTEMNLLLHYLNSRGQAWSLKEPTEFQFEQSSEDHMVFKSEKNDASDIKIPSNMFYSVGNMKKEIPAHKDNKKPILLTCLESFIVSRLGFLSMQKLTKSKAQVEDKLQYLNRWIKMAKEHYILYLPYISATAPRCHDMLKGDNSTELHANYANDDHYKHLFRICNKMLEMRNDDGMLQTYVMLDSELHPELMKKTLQDKHLMPLILQDGEKTLKTIHEHHTHEMDWDEFQSAANLVLAELEQEVLKRHDDFLKPESWGIGLDREASKKAELELIKLFVRSQKMLNHKVVQTVRSVSHESMHKSKKSDEDLKKSIIKFAEKEFEAAKKEASTDDALKKCIQEAEKKVDDDLKKFEDTSSSEISNEVNDFEHDTWMECVSARIFEKFVEVCKKNADYCTNLMDVLAQLMDKADPDSTSSIALENFHYAVTAALLKEDKIRMADVKKHLISVAKEEIKEMTESEGGKKPEAAVQESESESQTKDQGVKENSVESHKQTEEKDQGTLDNDKL